MATGVLLSRLSTVVHSTKQMARPAVEILIERIINGGCHEFVQYSLAQREKPRRIGE